MSQPPRSNRDTWNGARWPTGRGHYESWFVRANHPDRPLAFWIRYTIFAPAVAPERAEAELWAVWFDGEHGRVAAAKSEHPIAEAHFAHDRLDVGIAGSALTDLGATGTCSGTGHRLDWQLEMRDGSGPLLDLPDRWYQGGFPKAKVVVPRPACRFDGAMVVDGSPLAIDGWTGSQNHNWGPAHTDRYAWGQVAGFDGREDAFLECASARVRLGPVLSPWLTVAVLRLGQDEIRFNSLARAPRARVTIDGPRWAFTTANGPDRLAVTMTAEPSSFASLPYRDPPGGTKRCLNTKLASCELELTRPGQPDVAIRTGHRAAFELLGFPMDVETAVRPASRP